MNKRRAVLFFALIVSLILSAGPANTARAGEKFSHGDISLVTPNGWTAAESDQGISITSPGRDFMLSVNAAGADGKSTEEIVEEFFQAYSRLSIQIKESRLGSNFVFDLELEPDKYGRNLMRLIISPVRSDFYLTALLTNYARPGDYQAYQDEVRAVIKSMKSRDPKAREAIDKFSW